MIFVYVILTITFTYMNVVGVDTSEKSRILKNIEITLTNMRCQLTDSLITCRVVFSTNENFNNLT